MIYLTARMYRCVLYMRYHVTDFFYLSSLIIKIWYLLNASLTDELIMRTVPWSIPAEIYQTTDVAGRRKNRTLTSASWTTSLQYAEIGAALEQFKTDWHGL